MPTSIGWTAESLRLNKTTTFKLSRGKNFSYPGFVLYMFSKLNPYETRYRLRMDEQIVGYAREIGGPAIIPKISFGGTEQSLSTIVWTNASVSRI